MRVRVLGGKQPCYYVKIWLGIAEYSELPARHEEIRRRVGEALLTCTGVPAVALTSFSTPPALKVLIWKEATANDSAKRRPMVGS